jgi:hypothetical protein
VIMKVVVKSTRRVWEYMARHTRVSDKGSEKLASCSGPYTATRFKPLHQCRVNRIEWINVIVSRSEMLGSYFMMHVSYIWDSFGKCTPRCCARLWTARTILPTRIVCR